MVILRFSIWIIVEIAVVVAAVFLGSLISSNIDIIPRGLISFPSVNVTVSDRNTMVAYHGVIAAIVFTGIALICRSSPLENMRRYAIEIYGLVVVVTIAALLLFLTTNINFDPKILFATALVAFVLFVSIGLAWHSIYQGNNLISSAVDLLKSGLKFLKKPLGISVMLLALSPIVVAKLYVTDRDFANAVTRIRVALNQRAEHPYALENAFPEITFLQPMMVRFSRVDSNTAYVLERQGRIQRLETDTPYEQELVLDFSDLVGYVEVENGALGFDLHPEFGRAASPRAGYVYVYYTDVVKGGRQINRLSRFDLSLSNLAARRASEVRLINLNRSNDGFHNGGSVEFGPDGFLYLAIGEGSDRSGHQRLDKSLFGGILRIDIDNQGGEISHSPPRGPSNGVAGGYLIPNENPFVGLSGALEEFWALGLRNPFRISFDPVTGRLWVGDVGSTKWEEINVVESGGNYQFPYMEGLEATKSMRPLNPIGHEHSPIYAYIHTAYRRSVIGGTVYRGSKLRELVGKYIYADNYSGEIIAIPSERPDEIEPQIIARSEHLAQRGITSLSNTPSGDLFVTSLGASTVPTGLVSRLVPAHKARKMAKPLAKSVPTGPPDAESLYAAHCSRCHGSEGSGDVPDADLLRVSLPNFSSREYQASRTDEDLALVIAEGGGALGLSNSMPPWQGIMNDEEITAMVAKIRTFAKTR